MGSSICASVVCGFLGRFETKVDSKEVKRFDEITGKQYVKVINTPYRIAIIDGVSISDDRGDDEFFLEGKKIEHLEVGRSGDQDNSDHFWLGIETSCADPESCMLSTFTVDVPKEVADFAKKYGITPEWFLSMRVTC